MDSCVGTLVQARDSAYQAVFPLRGKVLNTEKATDAQMLANKELAAIIQALGCGIKDDYDEKKLKFDKIIIETDPDQDGMHIRVLLLTFFFRYMPDLIRNGHVYITLTPLYKVRYGSKFKYLLNDKELDKFIPTIQGKFNYQISRFKGLGEMSAEDMRTTAMDPNSRILVRFTIDDAQEASEFITAMMGDDTSFRKELITKANIELED